MKPNNHIRSFLLCALALIPKAIADNNDIELSVIVSGARPNEGQLLLAVFTNEDNYLKEPVYEEIKPVGKSPSTIFNLNPLKAGVYAISVIYDEDSNGKLNTGFLGIPKELIGMSNDAKGTYGPPSFEKAAFTLTKSQPIHIKLGKAKD